MTTPDQPQYAPVPAPKAASGLYIRIADALIAGGALIMFLFSFAPFVSEDTGFGTYHKNAWTFLTPVVLFVVFAAILLLASAFLDTFWHRDRQLVGLHRHHVQVGLALYALVTVLGFALSGAGADNPGLGWGGIFMLLGALIAAAGAVLNHFSLMQNKLSMPASSPKPVAPAGYPPAQGGYAPPQQGYAPQQQQGYAPQQQQGYPAPNDATQAYPQANPGYAQPQQGYVPPSNPPAPPTA
jgi:hypothetical protein